MSGIEIDIVEAGAAQHDGPDAQCGQCLDHLGIEAVVDEHADGIAAFRQRHGAGLEAGRLIEPLEAGIGKAGLSDLVEEATIVGLGTVDRNSHHITLAAAGIFP